MTKLAIVSDVHAFQPDAAATTRDADPSWVRTTDGPDHPRAPFQALEHLIEDEELSAEYLLCCGDMGDKADSAGIAYTWGWLETIRRRLNATTIATTGNHDVDSYDQSRRHQPKVFIKALQPPYPIDNSKLQEEYWRRHVFTFSQPGVDIVVLDSCADHQTRAEAERGRVTDATLDELRQVVDHTAGPIKVLLLHHHPYRHDAIERSDYSELDGGPEVLRILENNADWLVIHGHRHYPAIAYAAGGARAPVIVASGSFGAFLYPELRTRVRNQFAILDVDGPGLVPGTSGITGFLRAWEFKFSTGWVRPQSDEGIPDLAGFGFRAGLDAALRIATDALAKLSPENFLQFSDITRLHPELRYLLPSDRQRLLRQLATMGITISPATHYWLYDTEIFLRRP
jgi:hypothetical protein